MEELDFLVSVAGDDAALVAELTREFFSTLRSRCSLQKVNVFIVLRECWPVPKSVENELRGTGFQLRTCPLPKHHQRREDTSRVCDWMVQNVGSAPWFVVSHYDIVFHGDYVGYLRSVMPTADKIGSHHNGIVCMRRAAYQECQVGFCGIDSFGVVRNRDDGRLNVVPEGSLYIDRAAYEGCSQLDVDDLQDIRVRILGFRYVTIRKQSDPNDLGKSDLFSHIRDGSSEAGRQAKETYDKVRVPIVPDVVRAVFQEPDLLVGDTAVHFIQLMQTPKGEEYRILCMPSVYDFTSVPNLNLFHRTDVLSAVTCARCKMAYVSGAHR